MRPKIVRQRWAAGALTVVVAIAGVGILRVDPAEAAGVTTHTWMAMRAVPRVEDPSLRALLEANSLQLQSGAHFPDSGYAPGTSYGEEAHWPRFSYAYARQIRRDPSCGDLTRPDGPCAARIAHLFGAVAHGIGDEVWDWLFEPNARDRGEDGGAADLDRFGFEGKMDTIAIGDHGRSTAPADLPPWPAQSRLLGVFASVGRDDVTAAELDQGNYAIGIVRQLEPALTTLYHDRVTTEMPWVSAHIVTAPGGVRFAARAIAANWDDLWDFLLHRQGAAHVAVTYPAAGATDVPFDGWAGGSFGPGPTAGRARTRITAVLSTSLSYRADVDDPGSIPDVLDPATMTMTEVGTGTAVAPADGFPKRVPYGADSGNHEVAFQPATDLLACTQYRVDVTDALHDAKARPVQPYAWTFTTKGCPDQPPQPDLQVRAGSHGAWAGWDVHGVGATGQGVRSTTGPGTTTRFTVRLQNDGPTPERFTIAGQGSASGVRIRYLTDGGDTLVDWTAAAVAGNFVTPSLDPGERYRFEVEATVGATVDSGSVLRRTITATSRTDPSRGDAVQASIAIGTPDRLPSRAEAQAALPELAEVAQGLLCALG